METITIYIAGVSQGNPGPSAIGVYLCEANNQMICEVAENIGNATPSSAYYQAAMRGLQIAKEHFGEKTHKFQFELKLDSELVFKQLNDELEINQPGLVPYFIEIHNLRVTSFPNLSILYVPQDLNVDAHRLVNEVLEA